MLIRSLISVALGAGILCAGGCGASKPRQVSSIPGLSPDLKPADLQLRPNGAGGPEHADPDAGTIDALTRKAQQYTQQLQPLVQDRAATAASTHAAPVNPTPSKVEWMAPGQLTLNPGAAEMARTPAQVDQRGSVRAVVDVKDVPGAVPAPQLKAEPEAAIASAAPIRQSTAVQAMTTDALAQRLAQRIKDYPRDPSVALEYQLMQFLKDEPSPQLATLSALQPDDRELITCVLDGLTNLRNALRADQNMLLSRKIKPVVDIADRLRAQAELTIPTIALCRSVAGFGSYDPIDPPRFPAGKENRMIVYCEVANFTSMLGDQQLWETQLKWDMTLYTEQGMSVWSDKTETIKDTSRNRRHDFFVRKIIALPQTLTIGRFLLKVTIIDAQSNRVAEATTPIIIEAQ